ncbi:hypothetical protein BGX24_007450 [Mortierella sp. AD032]|nr:hypothetical protein BGX24_007450 [Mortierella sp. AD032]
MGDDDFTTLAKRLSDAVDTMNQASLFVYQMLRIIIWDELLRVPNSSTGGGGQPQPVFVLEDKAAGMALIKHLYALALNGKMDKRGPRTKKTDSKAVKAIAQYAYGRLLQIIPGFKPTNTQNIHLGRPIILAAQQVMVNLKNHFHKIPFTIGSRMLECGWTKDTLPEGSFKNDETSDDAEDQGSGSLVAPSEPSSRASPSCVLPSEGVQASVDKIMTAKEAHTLVDQEYGRLIKILFYGDRQNNRDSPSVWQTSYGKRTSIMDELSNTYSTVYGTMALQSYLTDHFDYISYARVCRDQDRVCDRNPPALPTDTSTDRYALSNIISTNGLALHTLCFDTTRRFRSRTSFAPIYRIERQFPTLQSILEAFGVDSVEEIDVWGVDPGEVNPAAFCRLERHVQAGDSSMDAVDQAEDDVNNPTIPPSVVANNLIVSRLALYSPILAHRNYLDTIKTQRPVLAPGQETTPDLWAKGDLDRDKTGISLPSIKDVENLVLPYQHDTQEDCEKALQRVFLVHPVLQGFYASDRIRKLNWELKKCKDAEIDWAMDALLRTCSRKTLFCYGNGKFRTGLNLAFMHETFKGRFAQKASSVGRPHCYPRR